MCDYILFSLIKIVYLASAPALLQQCIYKREKDDEVKTVIIIRENWKKTWNHQIARHETDKEQESGLGDRNLTFSTKYFTNVRPKKIEKQ